MPSDTSLELAAAQQQSWIGTQMPELAPAPLALWLPWRWRSHGVMPAEETQSFHTCPPGGPYPGVWGEQSLLLPGFWKGPGHPPTRVVPSASHTKQAVKENRPHSVLTTTHFAGKETKALECVTECVLGWGWGHTEGRG